MLYTAKPHGAAMTAMPLSPTPDRAGRTVRIDPNTHTVIDAGHIIDKKRWLNLVGPMAFMCTLPGDFTGSPASGIYSRVTTANGGVHAMLVVGFDDFNSCWIIKNSYGEAWGTNGFLRVAYGQSWLEDTQWWGVRNTNPDPWTKRRQRNGVSSKRATAPPTRTTKCSSGLDGHRPLSGEKGEAGWNNAGTVQSPRSLEGSIWMRWIARRPCRARSIATRAHLSLVFGRLTTTTRSGIRLWFNGMGPSISGSGRGSSRNPRDLSRAIGGTGRLRGCCSHGHGCRGTLDQAQQLPWTNPPGTWYRRGTVTTKGTAGGPALVSSRLNLTGELELNAGELHYVCASGQQPLHFQLATPSGSWTQVDAFGTGTSARTAGRA